MRNILLRFDAWLLSKFEAFSHWWQRLTGRNCFWLARVCLFFVMGYLLLDAFDWKRHGVSDIMFPIFFLTVLYSFGLLGINKLEKESADAQSRYCANPGKVVCVHIRVGLILFLSFLLVFEPLSPQPFLLLSMCYFCFCDPLPPAKSKVRQQLERMKEAVADIFTPAPMPQPIPIRVPSA